MPGLVEIGHVVLEKKMKMWKVVDDDNNYDGQQNILSRKAHLQEQKTAKKINKSVMTFKTLLLQKDMINFDPLFLAFFLNEGHVLWYIIVKMNLQH